MLIFNQKTIRHHKYRSLNFFQNHGFLFQHTAKHLNECIKDANDTFHTALDISFFSPLTSSLYDISIPLWIKADDIIAHNPDIVLDFEELPLADKKWDLIISNMTLHWINKVQKFLTTIAYALKPGGLFLASCLTEGSLQELRYAITEAEIQIRGGVSPRLSPLPSITDIITLLKNSPFDLPVVDQEKLIIKYRTFSKLIDDLKKSGSTNSFLHKIYPLSKMLLEKTEQYYQKDSNGLFPVTLEILYIHGRATIY